MKISVNILTWNNKSTLFDTLLILKEDLRDIHNEIIVVDNGSTDGCSEMATVCNFENKGVSVGKNQALELSQGEYVLILDGDTVPVPNSVNKLIEYLDEHEDCDAIGFYANKYTNQKNREGQAKHHEEYCHTLFEPQVQQQSIAYYGLFRKKTLDKHNIRFPEYGCFNKAGYGWEETDFYMQMCEAKIKQWVVGMNTASGKYYHEVNSSIREMGHDKYMTSSKERRADFVKKWGKKEKKYRNVG